MNPLCSFNKYLFVWLCVLLCLTDLRAEQPFRRVIFPVAFAPENMESGMARQEAASPAPRIVALHVGLPENKYRHYYGADALRDTIHLPEDALTVNLEFAQSDADGKHNQVYYKVDPLMDGFQPMAASGQISLVGLRPGQYRVHVRSWSADAGLERTWSWLLTKEPAFYETQLFYALLILVVVGITTLILFQRATRIKDEQALRKQISRDLHDEVGGLLAGISMQADLLLMNTAQLPESSVLAIGKYSREAVQMMDDIIWAIDVRNNYEGSLQERLEYLAFQMLEPKGIRVFFNAGVKADRKLPQLVRQNTYLICKEILHNILKHTTAEWVSIAIRIDKKGLTLDVRNNGLEEQPTEGTRRKGQGTRNMETRARQMNGNLSVTTQNGVYRLCLAVGLRNRIWQI